IACVSESVAGLHAAVLSGMAIPVLGRSTLQPGMREDGVSDYLPPLPAADLRLYRAAGRHLAANDALYNYPQNNPSPQTPPLVLDDGDGPSLRRINAAAE